MTYEIIPVANGFLLRIFTNANVQLGTRTYKLASAVQEELVFPNYNSLQAELKARLVPAP